MRGCTHCMTSWMLWASGGGILVEEVGSLQAYCSSRSQRNAVICWRTRVRAHNCRMSRDGDGLEPICGKATLRPIERVGTMQTAACAVQFPFERSPPEQAAEAAPRDGSSSVANGAVGEAERAWNNLWDCSRNAVLPPRRISYFCFYLVLS